MNAQFSVTIQINPKHKKNIFGAKCIQNTTIFLQTRVLQCFSKYFWDKLLLVLLVQSIFGTKHFRHKAFSAQSIFGAKHFRRKTFSAQNIFGTKHFRHKTFFAPEIFGAKHIRHNAAQDNFGTKHFRRKTFCLISKHIY